MSEFTYESAPQRVVFGTGTLPRVADELDRLGVSKVIVLTTAEQASQGEELADLLGDRVAGTFFGAKMHTPVSVTEQALDHARAIGADGILSLGGGSTIGLGKAIAVRTELPHIVVPTTYAGSEATPILGETQHGRKITRRSPNILPEVIVYDVRLTYSLPVGMTITSGMNAIAHAVEALYARDRNPIISRLAVQGIEALTSALPTIVNAPGDPNGRAGALFGAWVCGACLGAVGMALHHKLCHILGGSFGLPHAETHSVILPHATAYNERAAQVELRAVADLLGKPTAAASLWAFSDSLSAPMTLASLGFRESDIDRAVEIVLESPYWNPQPLVAGELRQLLENAWVGRPPATGF
jgi:alcohol dehydrogenase class IV